MTHLVREFKAEIFVREDKIKPLLDAALEAGFSRQYPRRQWLQAEEKRAITFLVRHYITSLQDP